MCLIKPLYLSNIPDRDLYKSKRIKKRTILKMLVVITLFFAATVAHPGFDGLINKVPGEFSFMNNIPKKKKKIRDYRKKLIFPVSK